MPTRASRPRGPEIKEPDTEDMRHLWTQVFAPSGALSGFCLEWLLDRAEFSNGRKS
ncbi:hypothetical protein KUV26_07485 [Leisingera daeponensis]|uniref:Uncharacterized protein n=1 Tax=Leisingera daeponensis TaxID=405746 RepID=A0ABS7NDJ3_9RHOB|nr:hypothetical protein [Leisingera daeponensis]MBY6056717.1 hypothetical protein [Leisingera daeponensis]MBY6139278.1 hypothetical protein [Leisingera daeponensis]